MNIFSRFSTILVAVLLTTGLVLTAGAGTTLAQTSDRPDPGMLPDHPMYFMTSMSESIGTFFTFGEVNQAERALTLSERRLAEARAFAANGKPDEAEKAVGRYQTQFDRALSTAKQAQGSGADASDVLSDVSEATPRHQKVLAEVHQNVPDQARPGIEQAMEASRRGGAEARSSAPGRRGATGRPDSSGQDMDRPDRDRADKPGAENRPDSAGPPPHAQGQGPPSSRGQNRPDAPDTDRPEENERPDSLDQDMDQPNRDRPDERGADARPESAGPPSHAQGHGPPSSRGQNRPDAPDADRPEENERPDSLDQDMDRPDRDRPDDPDTEDRPDREERSPPDSVETGMPDNSDGGR